MRACARLALEQSLLAQQAAQLRLENDQLRALAGVRQRLKVPAQVVVTLYESRDAFSRKVVVDRGSRDGLQAGGPVHR